MVPKVVLISDNSEATEVIVNQLNFCDIPVVSIIDSFLEPTARIPSKEPILVVLMEPKENVNISELIKHLKQINPLLEVLLLINKVSFSVVRDAMRAGVADVLRFPDEMNGFEKTCKNIIEQLKNNFIKREKAKVDLKEEGKGQLIAIYSGRGGTGKTFLAVNLAQAIKIKSHAKVLLIDLSLQFGSIHVSLGLDQSRSISDLKPVIYELNQTQLNNVVVKFESSGLEVLLGPSNPEVAETINEEQIELLLQACRRYYDYIIIDLPSELNRVSFTALNEADKIFYILSPETPSLITMKSVINLLDRYQIAKKDKFSLLLNRVHSKSEVSPADIKKLSPYDVIGEVRSDYQAIQSNINLGKPLLESDGDKGRNKLTRDIIAIADKVLSAS